MSGQRGVEDFRWTPGEPDVIWQSHGLPVRLNYSHPILRALKLRDGTGVAIVASPDGPGSNNFFVCNADGSLRFGVPLPREGRFWFSDVYYVRDILTLFEARGVDYAHELDERTGAITRTYETR